MRFLAFFRAKYFFVQNYRVLTQLIGYFCKPFVKNFRSWKMCHIIKMVRAVTLTAVVSEQMGARVFREPQTYNTMQSYNYNFIKPINYKKIIIFAVVLNVLSASLIGE